MALLQSTEAEGLTVEGAVTSAPEMMCGQRSGTTSYSTTGPIPQDTIHMVQKVTMTNTNSRFTIQEAGVYAAFWHNIGQNDATTSRTRIYKNGANRSQARRQGGVVYAMINAFVCEYMEVGDYFEMVHTAGTIYLHPQYNDFTIMKVA